MSGWKLRQVLATETRMVNRSQVNLKQRLVRLRRHAKSRPWICSFSPDPTASVQTKKKILDQRNTTYSPLLHCASADGSECKKEGAQSGFEPEACHILTAFAAIGSARSDNHTTRPLSPTVCRLMKNLCVKVALISPISRGVQLITGVELGLDSNGVPGRVSTRARLQKVNTHAKFHPNHFLASPPPSPCDCRLSLALY